ncbi:hypothetical protein NM208_g10301 [Fusarium decemcellulare]|uniref:Uncharacterized protein n=1 Tax=Fusarium decemcellulare TaxID=57161 RepID=A0ACC1RYC9_9HYPO|nr:hypothetical protein NM208_g10301 [Fusarium decemcellulare]
MAGRHLLALLWAYVVVLLQFTALVGGLDSFSDAGSPPRAALVALVHNPDLQAMLFTMQQLEEKFNNRYQYHWIFFSAHGLEEVFKELTSNATNATCIYEVIPDENWSIPGWTDQPHIPASQEINLDYDSETLRPMTTIRQMNRWNSAPFAKEKRLRDYDWFWRVEPGAQLTQHVPFDVFRYMRDNNIAYGYNQAILGQASLRSLSPRIKSFVDKHPDLLHEDADISWLLDDNEPHQTAMQSNLDSYAEDFLQDEDNDGLGHPESGLSQDDGEDTAYEDDEGTLSLGENFASWLSGIYGSSLYPTFEIGSLAFFRSHNHLTFFDHLDSAGDFEYRRVEDVPVHTLSASMFLPKRSVGTFLTKDMRHFALHAHRPSQPQATPDPDRNADEDSNARSARSMGFRCDFKEAMTALLAAWDVMAQYLDIPALLSGHTVIDERTFEPIFMLKLKKFASITYGTEGAI